MNACYYCEQFGPVAYCTTCDRPICAPELPSAKHYTTTDGKITQTYCAGCYQ